LNEDLNWKSAPYFFAMCFNCDNETGCGIKLLELEKFKH
jgi:hypothetical protein